MAKYRAIYRMTYEALAKWLGLPSEVEVIAVTTDQNKEIVSFHVSSSVEGFCPPTPEGAWAMSRLVDKREMIAPIVEKDLILRIGRFKLYRERPDGSQS